MLAVLGLLTVSGGEAPYRSVVVGPVNGMLEGNTLSIEALSVGQAYIVVSDAYDQTDLVSITVIESGLSQSLLQVITKKSTMPELVAQLLGVLPQTMA